MWSALNGRVREVILAARGLVQRGPLDRALRRRLFAASVPLLCMVVAVVGGVAVRTAVSKEMARERTYELVRSAAGGFSEGDLKALMQGAGPGAWRIAAYHEPDGPHWSWARPPGWARLDIDTPPNLGLSGLTPADAQKINAVMPVSLGDITPAQPFVLQGAERAPAVQCLTTAIYYEAALEPLPGQEAVAQVVLNRVRHADYPKSVCGVVFQGAERPGCQFSFACDGSMARAPAAWAWKRAKEVAEQALNGFVMKDVGTATHYHTDWIVARWTPTLVKVGQFGAHLFFRPPGPAGMPQAFNLAYRGNESLFSRVNLIGKPQVIATPDVLLPAAAQDAAPFYGAVVKNGRTIVMPGGTILLGRVHGVITDNGDAQSLSLPPMHAMIAMRAAAARAVREADKEQAQLAAAQAAEAAPKPSAPAAKPTSPASPSPTASASAPNAVG